MYCCCIWLHFHPNYKHKQRLLSIVANPTHSGAKQKRPHNHTKKKSWPSMEDIRPEMREIREQNEMKKGQLTQNGFRKCLIWLARNPLGLWIVRVGLAFHCPNNLPMFVLIILLLSTRVLCVYCVCVCCPQNSTKCPIVSNENKKRFFLSLFQTHTEHSVEF